MIPIAWNVEKYNFEKIEKNFTNKKLSPIHVTKLNFHTKYVTVSEILIKSKSFVVLAKQVLEFS